MTRLHPVPLHKVAQEKVNDSMFYHVSRFLFSRFLKAYWRAEVIGIENVPAQGAMILASNHLSFWDSIVIPAFAPRRIHFIAKQEYFTGKGFKGTVNRLFFTAAGCIPVDRDGAAAAQRALDIGLEVLRDHRAFGIYPEGTRSRDGRLYRGRPGVGYLVLNSNAPVVPVALAGTAHIQSPTGSKIPRRSHVRIQFGTPLDFTGRYEDVPPARRRKLIADDIMDAIAAMTDQVRVSEYNERPAA